ncbi:MAG TPA: Holliday junction resolvase RuvX [Candidatus Limnocylindrales bacterium]|nr:Holliday junction resolvase RuvX [Candidatus Limnocylindrales bacterium]
MTAFLGIDLGDRRIGVAIADGPDVGARPLITLKRGPAVEDDVSHILPLIESNLITELVVGLPLEAGGAEGPQALATRAWVDALAPRLGDRVAITLRDERLSSHLAESRLGPMRRGRSGGPPSKTQRDAYRARVDREAAAIILQDELDSRRATGVPQPRPTMETTP